MKPRIFAAGLNHPEGLAFDRDGQLWAGGESGEIYRIAKDGRKVEQLGSTRGFNLGLAFSPEGWLLICDCKSKKLWRFDPRTRRLSTFATSSGGRPLGHVNFPVFDSSGCVYVSDSGTWGKRDGQIHRFTPDGRGEPWLKRLCFANGLALSASEKELYVVQSVPQNVLRVPILEDGAAGLPRVFVRDVQHVPDGLALDSEGNLYVSCFGDSSIWKVTPTGRKSRMVQDLSSVVINRATNIAFGGSGRRSLFIANLGGWQISVVRTEAVGQELAGS